MNETGLFQVTTCKKHEGIQHKKAWGGVFRKTEYIHRKTGDKQLNRGSAPLNARYWRQNRWSHLLHFHLTSFQSYHAGCCKEKASGLVETFVPFHHVHSVLQKVSVVYALSRKWLQKSERLQALGHKNRKAASDFFRLHDWSLGSPHPCRVLRFLSRSLASLGLDEMPVWQNWKIMFEVTAKPINAGNQPLCQRLHQ